MKNVKQFEAAVIEVTAPGGGVTSGNGYLIGKLFGVAVTDADAAAKFSLRVQGVVNLPKNNTEATTEGAALYWDAGAGELTTTVGANQLVGVATSAELAAATTQDILLGYRMP